MGFFSDFELMQKQSELYKEDLALIEREINWSKNYERKIYDKLNQKGIDEILKSKIVIGESYYQKLKTNKTLLEIFLVIKTGKKENLKSLDLLSFGFKKTSIKMAIKKLIELNILNRKIYERFGHLKLIKNSLKKPKENYWFLSGKNAWYIFLLYGLEAAILYRINSNKSKAIKDKKTLHSVSSRKKVILQNAYYKNLHISNTKIYLLNKMICDYFLVSYKKMFAIVHKQQKKFITIKKNENIIHKFIGYKFKTLRYLLMRI